MHESWAWLLPLLIVPMLLALMLLMEWLENHFARRMVADEVLMVLRTDYSPDDVERAVATSAARIFPSQR